jgi:hypothetical protein
MINIAETFDEYEYLYIEEKLRSWIETDIKILEQLLTNYVAYGDPQYIKEFYKALTHLSSDTASIHGELEYIERKRNK